MISFSNSTELDLRLIQLSGVNVKPQSTNPIGYFGTGLKYALAVLLRTGHTVMLETGRHHGAHAFVFGLRPETIRGKSFQQLVMTDSYRTVDLPFTTEYGRNWEVWMAFRELYTNILDEGGGAVQAGPVKFDGGTIFRVDGKGIEQVYQDRARYILDPGQIPTWTLPSVEILDRPGEAIFMRNIRVLALDKPSIFTYNLRVPLTLTEDRQIQSTWDLKWTLAKALAECPEPEVIKRAIRATPDQFESGLDFQYQSPSETFRSEVASSYQSEALTPSAVTAVKANWPNVVVPQPAKTGLVHESALARARAELSRRGITISLPLEWADLDIASCTEDGTIYLRPETNSRQLVLAILEEHFSAQPLPLRAALEALL